MTQNKGVFQLNSHNNARGLLLFHCIFEMTKLRLKARKTLVPTEVGPRFVCPQGPCLRGRVSQALPGSLGYSLCRPWGRASRASKQSRRLPLCSVGMGREASLPGWPWAQGGVAARAQSHQPLPTLGWELSRGPPVRSQGRGPGLQLRFVELRGKPRSERACLPALSSLLGAEKMGPR